jgi:hypothetical protein
VIDAAAAPPVAPPQAAGCIVPGFYELRFDKQVKWQNADAKDKKDHHCGDASGYTMLLLKVEQTGGKLSISLRDEEPPRDEVPQSNVKVAADGECGATMQIRSIVDRLTVDAKLTFAGDKITGTASKATVRSMDIPEQEGDEESNFWSCAGKDIPLAATRVP